MKTFFLELDHNKPRKYLGLRVVEDLKSRKNSGLFKPFYEEPLNLHICPAQAQALANNNQDFDTRSSPTRAKTAG